MRELIVRHFMTEFIRVYGLGSPLANDIVYIGITNKTLNDCLEELIDIKSPISSNSVSKWILELLNNGQKPQIFEIDSTSTPESAAESLEFWQNYMKMLGVNLLATST